MTEPTWTEAEFAEFSALVDDVNAKGFNNPRRPIGRVNIKAFEAKHGTEKCKAMFAEIERREEEDRRARGRK